MLSHLSLALFFLHIFSCHCFTHLYGFVFFFSAEKNPNLWIDSQRYSRLLLREQQERCYWSHLPLFSFAFQFFQRERVKEKQRAFRFTCVKLHLQCLSTSAFIELFPVYKSFLLKKQKKSKCTCIKKEVFCCFFLFMTPRAGIYTPACFCFPS